MISGFLVSQVYPWISLIGWGVFFVFLAILILRMIFNYADPNPFGAVGRFGFKVRKLTEKWVYPAARLLAMFGVDTRLAPIVTILVALVFTFFLLQIVFNAFLVIDNLQASIVNKNPMAFIGFVLYGLLSLLILFIFIRFVSQWFVFHRKTFLGFVMKVTNPIIIPFQKLIPPVGMFDISAMIVLLLIGLLQLLVIKIFVGP